MKVVRTLSLDTRSNIEVDYTRPFHLVRMDFPEGSQYLSSGPQVVLENGLKHSEALAEVGSWVRTNIADVVSPGYVVPNGDLSLCKVVANDTSGSHYLEQGVAGVPDNAFVSASVYAKRGQYDYALLQLCIKDGEAAFLSYQFSTKTIVAQGVPPGMVDVFFEVEDLGDDLVRLMILNVNVLEGAGQVLVRCWLQSALPHAAFAGNNADGTLYGGVQLWTDGIIYPYQRSGASAFAPQTYIAGLVDVGQFSWGPDGEQNGQIELFNENNSAVALVLSNGVAEVPCTVFDCYVKADQSCTVPVLMVVGVLTDSDITPSSAVVSMATESASVEYLPNRYCTAAEGFNWLPPDNAQITWGNELYIFERE